MASEWHVHKNGELLGPFSSAQLKQMASTGQLMPSDLVTKVGGKDWVPAQQVKGLFSAVDSAAIQPQLPPLPALPPLPEQTEATAPGTDLPLPRSDKKDLLTGRGLARAGVLLLVLVAAILAIWVVANRRSNSPPPETPSASEKRGPSQAEARDILKKALDAWVAETWKEDLAALHPELDFVDPDFTDRFRMFRFDIARAERDSFSRRWTFQVSLVFRQKSADKKFLRYEREYYVHYPDDRGVWRITVFLKGYPKEVE